MMDFLEKFDLFIFSSFYDLGDMYKDDLIYKIGDIILKLQKKFHELILPQNVLNAPIIPAFFRSHRVS